MSDAWIQELVDSAEKNAASAKAWAKHAHEQAADLERVRAELASTKERAAVAVAEARKGLRLCEEDRVALEQRLEACEAKAVEPEPPAPEPAPEPEPEAPTGKVWKRRFRALDYVNTTPEENRSIFEEARKRDLGARAEVVDGKTWGAHKAPDAGGVDFQIGWDWGANVALGQDPDAKTGNVDVERCRFLGSASRHPDGAKWGMRRYGLGDTYVGLCDFADIAREHGIYDSVSGHALYHGLTFRGCGSQALQVVNREDAYQQYKADNAKATKRQALVIEDCHAVDCGNGGSRPGFVYSLFDPGSQEHPGIVVMRDVTSVQKWPIARMAKTYEQVPIGTPGSIRSTKGFCTAQFDRTRADKKPAVEKFVMTNCLFDHTDHEDMLGAVRGCREIVFHDSVFASRGHAKQPYIDIDDDLNGNESSTVIIDNCVCPPGAEVWLRVRGKRVCSMHQPGREVMVDVKAGKQISSMVSSGEPAQIALLQSPLAFKVGNVPDGFTPQPEGHVDDMPEQPLEFYEAVV